MVFKLFLNDFQKIFTFRTPAEAISVPGLQIRSPLVTGSCCWHLACKGDHIWWHIACGGDHGVNARWHLACKGDHGVQFQSPSPIFNFEMLPHGPPTSLNFQSYLTQYTPLSTGPSHVDNWIWPETHLEILITESASHHFVPRPHPSASFPHSSRHRAIVGTWKALKRLFGGFSAAPGRLL